MTDTTPITAKDMVPPAYLQAIRAHLPGSPHTAIMLPLTIAEGLLRTGNQLKCWLTERERQQLDAFKLAKRRKEWLTGRLCAKIAAGQHGPAGHSASPNHLEICNRESGQPFISPQLPGASDYPVEISISHSADFAVAFTARCSCGIDLQQEKNTLERVRERFCSTAEHALLTNSFPNLANLSRLNLLWAAKEAIRKSAGKDKVEEFLNIRFTGATPAGTAPYILFECSLPGSKIVAVVGHMDNYALAATAVEE